MKASVRIFGRIAQCTALACLFGITLRAESTTSISAIPTTWRLENYPSNGVFLWYTPSTCANGALLLPSPTEGDKNRLFALVLTAKVTNRPMFIYFDETQPGCPIISFGMDG